MVEVSDRDGLTTMVKTGLSFSFGSLLLIIVYLCFWKTEREKKKKTFWNIIKQHPSVMEYKQSGEMKTHLKIPLEWMRHATNTLYFSTLES